MVAAVGIEAVREGPVAVDNEREEVEADGEREVTPVAGIGESGGCSRCARVRSTVFGGKPPTGH